MLKAIHKYGENNFTIEILEQCDSVQDGAEKEKYWIERYRSFKEGYNATRGGDGRPYLDYDVLIGAYQKLQNAAEVAKQYGVNVGHLRKILKANGVDIVSSQEVNRKNNSTAINQLSLTGEYLQTFPSAKEAARQVDKPQGVSHITDVCKGRRQTAYGFKWEYA